MAGFTHLGPQADGQISRRSGPRQLGTIRGPPDRRVAGLFGFPRRRRSRLELLRSISERALEVNEIQFWMQQEIGGHNGAGSSTAESAAVSILDSLLVVFPE